MIQCGAQGTGRKQRDGRWEALRLSTERIHPKGEFISDDFKPNCHQVGCFVELLDPRFTCSGWFQIDGGGVLLESLSKL